MFGSVLKHVLLFPFDWSAEKYVYITNANKPKTSNPPIRRSLRSGTREGCMSTLYLTLKGTYRLSNIVQKLPLANDADTGHEGRRSQPGHLRRQGSSALRGRPARPSTTVSIIENNDSWERRYYSNSSTPLFLTSYVQSPTSLWPVMNSIMRDLWRWRFRERYCAAPRAEHSCARNECDFSLSRHVDEACG